MVAAMSASIMLIKTNGLLATRLPTSHRSKTLPRGVIADCVRNVDYVTQRAGLRMSSGIGHRARPGAPHLRDATA